MTDELKKYKIIYADPPWNHSDGTGFSYGDKDPRGRSGKHGISSHSLPYPIMSVDKIKKLKVGELAEKDSLLFLLTTNRFLEEALKVSRGWGFIPSATLVWCKPHNQGLFGGAFLSNIEFLIMAKRGSPKILNKTGSRWFTFPRRKHSEKPWEIRKIIESITGGKRVELFARQKTEGWDVWGNEVESDIKLGGEEDKQECDCGVDSGVDLENYPYCPICGKPRPKPGGSL